MSTLRTLIAALGLAACAFAGDAPKPVGPPNPDDVFGSERARSFVAQFPKRGALADKSIPPRSAQEAVASFKLMPGLKADVVLHEPAITQPLFMNFDERGRLWVVEFIQYPYPAGLKIMDLGDQFHAVYDKVPPPPPRHVRGADRVSIHEDRDGDGVFESHKIFLDGLNLVTSVEWGRGGVWVLNPPYLLFYPDADRDDVPDADPVVHLAGFGLEDTHSIANSLRWGPDGWLYGAHGSGVSAKIRRPGIDPEEGGFAFKGQAVWRYHPERRVFELFAEGGGNTFSLWLDGKGRVFSGTNGANTRGYHYVQGSYQQKSWGEHGYLTNPNAYGFFNPMPHNVNTPRFGNALLYYEDGRLGEACEGRFISGEALTRRVTMAERIPDGSSYRTKDIVPLIETDDRWFRPVCVNVGPDGALYLADFYDTRIAHMDPRDTWDRERGRIYRLASATADAPRERFDLASKSGPELVGLLSHRLSWFRKTALRLLADRRDRSLIGLLEARAREARNPHALDALWALHAVGGFSPANAPEFLAHAQPEVRLWAVRLLGDREHRFDEGLARNLSALARSEPDAQVRSQLGASARRFPADVGLPIVFGLLGRAEDFADRFMPLLLWWSLEHFVDSRRDEIVAHFSSVENLSAPLPRKHIVHRLARRFASYPSAENQQALAALARAAPEEIRGVLRQGIAEAFEGRGIKLSPAIESALFSATARDFSDPLQMSLAIKGGDQNAVVAALGFIVREEPPLEPDRIRVIQALADARAEAATPALLDVLRRSPNPRVRDAALAALGRSGHKTLVEDLLQLWAGLDRETRQRALALLVTRPAWARELLYKAADREAVAKSDISDELAQRARLLGDPAIDKILDRHFARARAASSAEKQQRIAELSALLGPNVSGNAQAGRQIFDAKCAACHKLHARGGDLGPDLTGYERHNLPTMLLNIVDPSLSIREGYALFQLNTRDDRTLVGFIDERDANRVVLRDPAGQRTPVALAEISREKAVPISMMPEGLLDGLSPQELRDFFAYLSSPADPAPKTTSN